MITLHDSAPDPAQGELLAQLQQSVLNAARVGLVVFDGSQRVTLWNGWMEQHAQVKACDALGKTFAELFPDMVNGRTHIAVAAAIENNLASLLSQTLNKSPFPLYTDAADAGTGTRMQQAVHVMPLQAGAERHCLVQVSDVSMAVARERKLREQAFKLESQTLVDGLTGIANRRRFDRHLEDEFRRAKRNAATISLIMIDVDYFKDYNDNYGHQRGDGCLVEVAAALARQMNRSRDLAARYGGEEFVAVLPDTGPEGALQVAETMRAAVETLRLPHEYSDVALYVTISLGVGTIAPDQHSSPNNLIHAADLALYQAKRSGRNRVKVYSDEQPA